MPADWLANARLWLVLDRAAAAPRSLTEVTRECIAGGVDAVVFRAKELSPDEALPRAREVRDVCRETNTPFVLSHFVNLVTTLQPDALHLGVSDLVPGPASPAPWPSGALQQGLDALKGGLPPSVALGYSAHSIAELQAAFAVGADYAFLGPIFATPSKLQYGAPLGLSVVTEAAAIPRPVVCIGGISAATLPQVLATGGCRVAAISALQSVADPRAATSALKRTLDR